jgi:hypothetical protein
MPDKAWANSSLFLLLFLYLAFHILLLHYILTWYRGVKFGVSSLLLSFLFTYFPIIPFLLILLYLYVCREAVYCFGRNLKLSSWRRNLLLQNETTSSEYTGTWQTTLGKEILRVGYRKCNACVMGAEKTHCYNSSSCLGSWWSLSA